MLCPQSHSLYNNGHYQTGTGRKSFCVGSYSVENRFAISGKCSNASARSSALSGVGWARISLVAAVLAK